MKDNPKKTLKTLGKAFLITMFVLLIFGIGFGIGSGNAENYNLGYEAGSYIGYERGLDMGFAQARELDQALCWIYRLDNSDKYSDEEIVTSCSDMLFPEDDTIMDEAFEINANILNPKELE